MSPNLEPRPRPRSTPPAGTQAYAGELRGRDARVPVAGDAAEAVAVRPVGPRGRDLLVAAAHEVPPHHEFVGERLAAQQHRARTAPAGGERERVAAGAEVQQRPGGAPRARGHHLALDHAPRVLEVAAQRDARRPPRAYEGSATCCAKPGASPAASAGSASHSCRACSRGTAPTENSEWV